jgi:hypothetical protein
MLQDLFLFIYLRIECILLKFHWGIKALTEVHTYVLRSTLSYPNEPLLFTIHLICNYTCLLTWQCYSTCHSISWYLFAHDIQYHDIFCTCHSILWYLFARVIQYHDTCIFFAHVIQYYDILMHMSFNIMISFCTCHSILWYFLAHAIQYYEIFLHMPFNPIYWMACAKRYHNIEWHVPNNIIILNDMCKKKS